MEEGLFFRIEPVYRLIDFIDSQSQFIDSYSSYRGNNHKGKTADEGEKGREGEEFPAGERGGDFSVWWGARWTGGITSVLQRQDGNTRQWGILKEDRELKQKELLPAGLSLLWEKENRFAHLEREVWNQAGGKQEMWKGGGEGEQDWLDVMDKGRSLVWAWLPGGCGRSGGALGLGSKGNYLTAVEEMGHDRLEGNERARNWIGL